MISWKPKEETFELKKAAVSNVVEEQQKEDFFKMTIEFGKQISDVICRKVSLEQWDRKPDFSLLLLMGGEEMKTLHDDKQSLKELSPEET